jgi:hypothetical protein
MVLEHNERSEECPKGVNAIKWLINEMSYSIFLLCHFFNEKKKIFESLGNLVEGFHPRSRLRSAATPQYPSFLFPSITRRHGNFAGVHTLLRILLSSNSAVLINIITGVLPPHFDFVVYYVLCQC